MARMRHLADVRDTTRAVEVLAGLQRGERYHHVRVEWDGRNILVPAVYLISAEALQGKRLDRVFVEGRAAKPSSDGVVRVPMTRTTGAHVVRLMDAEGIETYLRIKVTRETLSRIGKVAETREPRQQQPQTAQTASAAADGSIGAILASAHSALARIDYHVSADTADAFLDLIRAWRDASPENRAMLLSIATEEAEADEDEADEDADDNAA
jgi:hypothetical protein